MGYEVHITRAESWLDADEAPISPEELYALAEAEPDLHVDRETCSDHEAEDGTVVRIFGVRVGPPDDEAPYLWAGGSDITAKSPDAALIRRMVKLASKLNAQVQGDEEEVYTLTPDGRLLADGEPVGAGSTPQPPPSAPDMDVRLALAGGTALLLLGVACQIFSR